LPLVRTILSSNDDRLEHFLAFHLSRLCLINPSCIFCRATECYLDREIYIFIIFAFFIWNIEKVLGKKRINLTYKHGGWLLGIQDYLTFSYQPQPFTGAHLFHKVGFYFPHYKHKNYWLRLQIKTFVIENFHVSGYFL